MQSKAIKFRVHVFATLLLASFVVSLVALFLLFATGRFGRMAEDNAEAIFSRMADAQAQKLEGLVRAATQAVETVARLPADDYRATRADSTMAALLRAQVAVNPALYGAYFGLADGSFFQVIGFASDADAGRRLGAPEAARFALRSIDRRRAGQVEHWRFIGEDGTVLEQRSDDSDYDPRTRPWYADAPAGGELGLTDPYRFQSSSALGVTLVRRIAAADGVVGVDLSLASLSEFVRRIVRDQPGGSIVIDHRGRILASAGQLPADGGRAEPLMGLGESGHPFLQTLQRRLAGDDPSPLLEIGGERYLLAVRAVALAPRLAYRVVSYAPLAHFAAPVLAVRDQIIVLSTVALAIALPLAYGVSRRASWALDRLAEDSERVRELDFSGDTRIESMFYEIDVLGDAHRTMKHSLRERTEALKLARDKLSSLVDSGLALAAVHDSDRLLASILLTGKRLANADAGTLYLATGHDSLRFALRTRDDGLPATEIPLHDPESGEPNQHFASVHAALNRHTVVIDELRGETRFDVSGALDFDRATGYVTVSQVSVPMISASGELLGVMQLINALDPETGKPVPFDPEIVKFIEALAAQAAMALDNHHLLESQREMMDSLIRIIAGAIDAKSAYTGGHCERVPELAVMLAEAACEEDEGPLAGFTFADADAWREFRIGAWLHDCGKVTTPEYVVDKATKLETLYNRIHEIRTRFEVLLRDARIEALEARLAGDDEAGCARRLDERTARLQADFDFVAACNIGGEGIPDDCLARLGQIAAQTWQRHFDDRLGLSHEEAARHARTPAPNLPATETLLADKDHHRIERRSPMADDPALGLNMAVPELLYNLGEHYNLSVARGTLTTEERFKVNEHIIQTILMLDRLPLPKNLRRVPEYASTHHETLVGTGYPRGLVAGQLSIPARIMAIADIFEALTASDRPYKEGKRLSEAVQMLADFCDRGHIDRDLFELFLRRGVHLRYAGRFLAPGQIDAVDITRFVGARPSSA